MRSPQHICVLTTAHPVDDVRVNSKFVSSFLAEGYRVSWVGPRNSSVGDDPPLDPRVEYFLTKRITSRRDRLLSSYFIKKEAQRVGAVDWYYSPDPDAGEVAVKLAAEQSSKTLLDLHEVYHGPMLDRWTFGRRATLLRNYVRGRITRTVTKSDLAIGVSDSVLAPYISASAHVLTVRNCAPLWFMRAADESNPAEKNISAPFEDSITTFMHGRDSVGRGTPVILRALELLGGERRRVRIVMFQSRPAVDSWNQREDGLTNEHQSTSVRMLQPVPHSQMPTILQSCQVGLIAYGRSLGGESLPNRLFEYMAAGVAILAPSYSPEIRRIVESERIGLTVDFEDPRGVADALNWFVRHPSETAEMGARAQDAFVKRHNWDVEFRHLVDAMSALDSMDGAESF